MQTDGKVVAYKMHSQKEDGNTLKKLKSEKKQQNFVILQITIKILQTFGFFFLKNIFFINSSSSRMKMKN